MEASIHLIIGMVIIIILIILLFCYWNLLNIYTNDVSYHLYFIPNRFKNLEESDIDSENNGNHKRLSTSRLLFITFDNRPHLEFVKIHNKNIKGYAQKWNYDYIYMDSCSHNTYWCKLYLVLEHLNTDKYDYVIWLDSDTIINNYDICFGELLSRYDKDIFIGHDNNPIFNLVNAGVFAIKNTSIGKEFITDCINNFDSNCLTEESVLNGIFGGTCYEQGIMNLLIANKYKDNTMILSQDIIYNNRTCRNDVFIMHRYDSSPTDRKNCFLNAPKINSL